MILYAETSAVLRWLLAQEHGEPVRLELERADRLAVALDGAGVPSGARSARSGA